MKNMAYIIGLYVIRRKVNKENVYTKYVTTTDPVTGSFSIKNLLGTTWLTRHPIPMEIMHDKGSEFIGHRFRKSLIEK